jgi:hypothetical protein
MAPAGGGSVFALSTALVERAEPVHAELDRWLTSTSVVRAYDTSTMQARRSQRFRGNIILPGAMTALLGVVLAVLRQRSLTTGSSR